MIEDTTILFNGKHHSTRLHEHGETGYIEGTEEFLNALKDSSTTLTFYKNGKEYETIVGITWGPIQEYGSTYILHLEWEI